MSDPMTNPDHRQNFFAAGLVLSTVLALGVLSLGYAQTSTNLSQDCINAGITSLTDCETFLRTMIAGTNTNTAATVPGPICGNNVCESSFNETAASCPHDCPACGDNKCETDKGETPALCPSDCKTETNSTTSAGTNTAENTNESAVTNTNVSSVTNANTSVNAIVTLPQACRDKGIANEVDCERFLASLKAAAVAPLDPQCREKGVTDPDACRAYLEWLKNHPAATQTTKEPEAVPAGPVKLPDLCVKAGVGDPTRCQQLVDKRRQQEQAALSLPAECRERGITDTDECRKLTEALAKQAEPPKLASACLAADIQDPKICADFLDKRSRTASAAKTAVPKECSDKGVFSVDECRKLYEGAAAADSAYSPPGGFKVDVPDAFLPTECQDQKLSGLACKDYLEKLYKPATAASLPPTCLDAGIKTRADCQTFVTKRTLPKECQDAGIANADDCAAFFQRQALPADCMAKGATTRQACEALLAAGKPSKSCADADDHATCIPTECAVQGITNRQACEKQMFEKYVRPAPAETAAALPEDCQRAGATDAASCAKIMEVRYFPSQCQAAGITDQEACAKFIEISNLPLLCRDNGATTRDECEKMQRRNFLAPACAKQGILDSAACEAFAAANIKGQVSCPGLSSEECGLKIRNRSLGGILEAQSRIENVRQRLAEFKDKHVEIVIVPEGKQPTAEQARIRDVMPVEPDEDRGFSLVDSESGIGFTADERVVTASPAFLMYDTDGDGMPDDVEQRHGSDPTKKDTNDDGIADGDEFKAMLAGKTKPGLVELAPIEKAVILGKAVGQPILEGALDEALKVEKAVSEALPKTTAAANVKSKAPPLKLSGKGRAGTVLTLYVYSNLPLVATVTVDA
ncbi:MAG: hypothetical protein AAB692_04315, partial [Patescibacteria group bacterium]